MIIYIYQGMLASGVATEGKGEVMREEGKSSQKKKKKALASPCSHWASEV